MSFTFSILCIMMQFVQCDQQIAHTAVELD